MTSRPRDAEATRTAILSEGRRLFAQLGYSGTTVKAVADAAGVSPNLITRYFGGKDGLFLASTETELNLEPVLSGPVDTLGTRLAASIVRRWSGIDGEDPLLILQRASGEKPTAAATLSDYLDTQSLEPLRRYLRAEGLSASRAHAAALSIDAFVLGVSTRHRVLRDDLHDLPAFKTWLATSIQRLIG